MANFERDVNTSMRTYRYLFGRTVLRTSLGDDELTPENIKRVLEEVLPIHFDNRKQMDYLYGYYRGLQDILKKQKSIREDINNRILENNAYHIVEFSKGYVFGDPIQYVQRGDKPKDEIDILNKFMAENDKASKDVALAEDWYITGTAYRMTMPNEDAELPFKVYIVNPKNTAVVYSNGYENEPRFAFYIAAKKNYDNGNVYYVLTVYTKTSVYTFKTNEEVFKSSNNKDLVLTYLRDEDPMKEVNPIDEIPIIEYPLNKSRLGKIELVKTTLDALNTITSNDLDDIEQFVQSLLALINVDMSADEYRKMLEAGAIKLVSKGDRGQQADIKLLSNKLEHSETKVLYDRIYNNMLTIAGVPKMTDKASSGDTGQARLVGEGWTMADERAKQDELAFKMPEKRFIQLVINICKQKNTGIKELKTSDIEIKFTRNKSDNLLVKTQALMNLKEAQVDPSIAMNVVGLFSDSNDTFKQSQTYFGEDLWKPKEEPKGKNPATDPLNKGAQPNTNNQNT